jgi:hypothetical protein
MWTSHCRDGGQVHRSLASTILQPCTGCTILRDGQSCVALEASNGIEVDVALGSFPFEEGFIDRATPFKFHEGVELITASAEDIFVLKAFAGRPQDWIDVESIAVRQGPTLDWDFIRSQLEMLGELVADSELMSRVEEIRRRASL